MFFNRDSIFILLILSLLLAACGKPNLDPNRILASGNSFKITFADFQKMEQAASKNSPLEIDPSVAKQFKRKLLEEKIDQILLEQQADRLNITVSEEEVASYVQKFKSLYNTINFEEALKEAGLSEQEFHQKQQNLLKIQKMIDQMIDEQNLINPETLEKYYQEHPEVSTFPEEVRLRQIVTDSKEKAELILRRLNQGENFARLARDLSLSPDRKQGGDLGFIRKGQFPREFDTCFTMNPGELSPIIPSLYGFHLFKVLEKNPARKLSFEESKNKIAFLLRQETREKLRQNLINDLRKKAEIKIDEGALNRL